MLRTASSLPLTGLLTLGSGPARFQTKPPACYRASWTLGRVDVAGVELAPPTGPPLQDQECCASLASEVAEVVGWAGDA
jgi:hypothetical protein